MIGSNRPVVALVFVLTMVVSGCSSDPEPVLDPEPLPSVEATVAAESPELDRFTSQDLTWSKCGNAECTKVTVPVDYEDPAGETLGLSVIKVSATDQDRRIGSMVVNPGGPGVSGLSYARQASFFFGAELRAAFDIVGFDPRGVGESRGIDCVDDAYLDSFIAADPDPDTDEERQESRDLIDGLGRGCEAADPGLVGNISTEDAARDLDILRGALGQESLVYFGASYGTYLGATYADLFPDRVGRLVLDGAIDPTVTTEELALTQAQGFETALTAYVDNCVASDECPLGRTTEGGLAKIQGFLDSLDDKPIPGLGERQLTKGNAVYGIWLPLYNKDTWSVLDLALRQAFEGDGQALLSLSDQYVSRQSSGYADNSIEANLAINCLDHADAPSAAEEKAAAATFVKASPTFGAIFAAGLGACRDWPVETGKGPAQLTAEGAAPIVVVGTTRDPATPFVWAQALADQLDSGVLVARDGDGHTGYRAGNQCVDDAVERYLVSGEVPEDGLEC